MDMSIARLCVMWGSLECDLDQAPCREMLLQGDSRADVCPNGESRVGGENIPDLKQGKPPEMVVTSSEESIWETCLSMDMATESRIHS